ncbi:MAG: ATP-dependent DNA helicase RecG, partial [Clostridia bacterium]|nr:ATP-dependent DNA helicase RecG [Clostridia bacterium]
GVGPGRARELERLGIRSVGDLVRHVPRRYVDRSRLVPIGRLRAGEAATVQAVVTAVQELRPRPNLHLLKVAVTDGSGTLYAVWFNQPYLRRRFRAGQRLILSGRVDRSFGQIQMHHPEVEELDGDELLHAGRIVPVYPATASLPQRALRVLARNALEACSGRFPDPVPAWLRESAGLAPAEKAWRDIHFPTDAAALERARRRLAFEELFLLQVAVGLLRAQREAVGRGYAHRPDGELVARLRASLPFRLTRAQERVIGEVFRDMEALRPMLRLVEGDVGSGKTVVAAFALAKAVDSGWQGALMAPTEILAEQHARVLTNLLSPLGVQPVLLTGRLSRAERAAALAALASGRAAVVVGTHALIQEGVVFRALSCVVVDEQHRFGVRQRALLQGKGENPDVLVMTATPIPRTLALTVFGDIDVSVVDELPPGRKPVQTTWLPAAERRRAYDLVRREVAAGHQAYVICPLVEESEAVDARAVGDWAERLRRDFLPGLRIAVLHGRMGGEEKEAVMRAFAAGETDVLVATTVVEVGVDVPNATVIVIEGAERFGLAQLHQLRGRVGRGSASSYCLLVAESLEEGVRERLDVLVRTTDGFAVAEADLALRGPGEFLGTRQHGLPDLRFTSFARDQDLLQDARRAAFAVLARDRGLRQPEHAQLRAAVLERFADRIGHLLVG